jgi:hypothetical protein
MPKLESVFAYVEPNNQSQCFFISGLAAIHDIPVKIVPKSNGVLPQVIARIKGKGFRCYNGPARIKKFFEAHSKNKLMR